MSKRGISIDDVRQAIGDEDPNNTNANRIRDKLGRGSMGTIQKHLNAIREGIEADNQPETPMVTDEAVKAIWDAAIASAKDYTMAQIIQLQAANSELRDKLEAEQATNKELCSSVKMLKKNVSDSEASVKDANDKAESAEAELKTVTAQLEEAHKQINTLTGLISDKLASKAS